MNAWTLMCAQVGCEEAATRVVVQTHGLALLFRSGAGVMCDKHAAMCDEISGVSLSLQEFAEKVVEQKSQ